MVHPDAPPPIRRLCDWLEGCGFAVVAEQSAGPSNQFTQFNRDGDMITVVCDRGAWSLSARAAGMSAEFHPDEWEAWRDGFDLAGELSSLDHQVDFLIDRWSAVVESASRVPGAEDAIREIGRDYVNRRFGFRL